MKNISQWLIKYAFMLNEDWRRRQVTRSSIKAKIESLGARLGSSVSKNTDYLIEKAGSKLSTARELGVTVISERRLP